MIELGGDPTPAVEVVLAEGAVDGDTLVGGDGRRIRLFGIDAPEMDGPAGADAHAALVGILQRGPVRCVELYRDRWRRSVSICMGDGGDVGRELLTGGFATEFCRYSHGYYGGCEDR